ncbi:putative membrane protein [Erwinia toletana]|uniref:Membrane protein n=1 Tax=Winslowiella toletana TaxID=92490 RepID=A0ABS4P8W5_9GAMM|nr:DUF2157 domain-containing protein [Winslowiella toletana]MBP2169101.1 putative membrane protein [Winslowiella toletana]
MENHLYAGKAATAAGRAVRRLQSQGQISPATQHAILQLIGARPDAQGWLLFLRATFALIGTLSLVCGVIFFFAWNWHSLPRMLKFALVEGAIIALAVLVWWRWAQNSARLALIAIGMLTGVLFAVYGQVYQTGAGSWMLFRAWAVALFALACFARVTALWFLCWLVANVAFLLRLDGWQDFPFNTGFSLIYQLSLLAALVAWYALTRSSNWLFRLMVFWTLVTLTVASASELFGDHQPYGVFSALLWLAMLVTGYLLFYRRQRDLFILTCGLFSISFLLVAGVIRLLVEVDIILTLVVALVVLCLCAAQASRWILKLRAQNPDELQPEDRDEQQAIWMRLQQQSLLTPQQIALLQQDNDDELPWYVRAALVLSGWFAGVMAFALLVLACFLYGLFDQFEVLTFVLIALVSGVPGWLFLSKSGLAQRQIGLSWAIACSFSSCVAVALWIDDRNWISGQMCLAFVPVLALLFILFRDNFYRYLNSAALVFFLVSGLTWFTSSLPVAVSALITIGVILAGIDDRYTRRFRPCLLGVSSGLLALCFYGSVPMENLLLINEVAPRGGDFSTLNEGIAAGLLIAALILGRREGVPGAWQLLLIATVLATMSLFAPGIALAWLLLLLARFQNSKVLMAAAAVLLVLYTIDWYYFLGTSLLDKALMLFAAGVVLLLIAALAHRRLQGGEYA